MNGMERITYVIDTNVLLHDPRVIEQIGPADVYVPIEVLEELSSFKRQKDELGDNARQAVRFFDRVRKLGDLRKGVELEGDVRVALYVEKAGVDLSEFPYGTDRQSRKMRAAFALSKEVDNVVYLTKDLVIRLKAEAVGLTAQDYELPKMTYAKLYKGYRDVEVSSTEMSELHRDGHLTVSMKFEPNEFGVVFSKDGGKVLTKFNASQGRLEMLAKFSRPVWGIKPRGREQECALSLLLSESIPLVTLVGQAGTGKTLLALAAGLKGVFEDGTYDKILVTRPIMPLGRDIGYLPGTKEEKLAHWMQPIQDNLEVLARLGSNRDKEAHKTLETIIDSPKVEMEAVTYIRGRTLPRCFMIIDEAQNLTPHEVKTVISRAGEGTKVVLTGDATQIDHPFLDEDTNALTYLVGKFHDQALFGQVHLTKYERSPLAALAAELL